MSAVAIITVEGVSVICDMVIYQPANFFQVEPLHLSKPSASVHDPY